MLRYAVGDDLLILLVNVQGLVFDAVVVDVCSIVIAPIVALFAVVPAVLGSRRIEFVR
jgi:hypothetical protein